MKRNEIETAIIGTGKICLLNADLTQDRPLVALIFMIMTLSVCVCTSRGYVVMSLISHPYGDSSAPYLGTAILTILYKRHE